MTEAAERKTCAEGECQGGRVERMNVKNQTESGTGTGNMARRRHRMVELCEQSVCRVFLGRANSTCRLQKDKPEKPRSRCERENVQRIYITIFPRPRYRCAEHPLCALRWGGRRGIYEPFVGIWTLLCLLCPSQPAGITQRLGTLRALLLCDRVGRNMA